MRKNIHPKFYKSSIRLSDNSIFYIDHTINKNHLILENDKSMHPVWNPYVKLSAQAGQVSKFKERYNFKI